VLKFSAKNRQYKNNSTHVSRHPHSFTQTFLHHSDFQLSLLVYPLTAQIYMQRVSGSNLISVLFY